MTIAFDTEHRPLVSDEQLSCTVVAEDELYESYLKFVHDGRTALRAVLEEDERHIIEEFSPPLSQQDFALRLQAMSAEKRIEFIHLIRGGHENAKKTWARELTEQLQEAILTAEI